MLRMFKVGDQIRCMTGDAHEGRLTEGKVYAVVAVSTFFQGGITIVDDIGDRSDWLARRFELTNGLKRAAEKLRD